MFGYVRPSLARLTEEDKARFGAAYCGLCRVLGERYGQAARFILNYDFTFLAILLWPTTMEDVVLHRGCIAHPLRKRAFYPDNEALELAADESVILAWWQMQDALSDPGKGKGKYRAAALALKGAYRRASEQMQDFDRITREKLAQLRELEEAACPSMDRPADAFAGLLAAAADEVAAPVKRRVLAQLLYHLGRWVYLVDAADDLAKDAASGSYNPIRCRFGLPDGTLTEEAREALVVSLDHSIRLMAAAYELWDFGPWSSIIQATLYEGLFCVGKAVLEGTFQANDMTFHIAGRNKEQL
ncbi:MAG: hypothetical protein K2N78_08050 [Oscillospiraceae bacterium]|nr:hypothetical protein [Oscillospiraceae bacterium]